jgi:hypothetical protein
MLFAGERGLTHRRGRVFGLGMARQCGVGGMIVASLSISLDGCLATIWPVGESKRIHPGASRDTTPAKR